MNKLVSKICTMQLTAAENDRPSANIPDSKVHGAYMGPTWGRQDPGGPHVGPIILAIWDIGD